MCFDVRPRLVVGGGAVLQLLAKLLITAAFREQNTRDGRTASRWSVDSDNPECFERWYLFNLRDIQRQRQDTKCMLPETSA